MSDDIKFFEKITIELYSISESESREIMEKIQSQVRVAKYTVEKRKGLE